MELKNYQILKKIGRFVFFSFKTFYESRPTSIFNEVLVWAELNNFGLELENLFLRSSIKNNLSIISC